MKILSFKKYFFLVLIYTCVFFSQISNAQSPFVWAQSGVNSPNPTSNNEGYAVAVDKKSNVFATGYFSTPSMSFGTYTLNNSNSSNKLYLTKYDKQGVVKWAKTINGESMSVGNSVACDDSGNVYLAGYYSGGLSIQFPPLTITNTNAPKFFLAKYDSSGNALWVQSMGQHYLSSANSVTIDHLGNIYLATMCYDTTVVFDTITVTNTYPGQQETYLARYNAAGHPLWVKHFGSNNSTHPSQVTTDMLGNIYLSGQFNGPTLIIGPDTLHNAGSNSPDVFVSKFSSSGNSVWNKSIGGTAYDFCSSICADRFGHLYVGGYYYSSTITLGPNTFTNAGAPDGYLAKMNGANGNITWSQGVGGVNYDIISSICTDTSGNIFFTGGFDLASSMTFPYKINFGADTLQVMASSLDPAFIIKIDSAGHVINSVVMQSGGDDMLAIAKDPTSPAIYISGDAINNPWYIGNDTLTGGINSGEYIFTAKLDLSNTGLYASTSAVTGTVCTNACSASAYCYPAGGTPPYSFLWLPGNQTASSVSGLCAGNYTVIVTDANSNSVSHTVSAAYISSGPTITSTVTPVSCNGLCDGSYTLSISGGTQPYSFFNPCNNSNLCPGSCIIQLIDMNGCSATDTIIVSQPPQITATISVTDASCSGCANGSLTCNLSGGVPMYSYLWQPGNLSGSAITGLLPRSYTCCVTDTKNCQRCFVDSVSFTGGISLYQQNEISIFPNPTTEQLTIDGISNFQNSVITIQNTLGQIVKKLSFNKNISVSELQEGCYFLKISFSDGKNYESKFIKQ